MVDRPLRPMFPKGMTNEVQIIITLLQCDEQNSTADLAITAASMAIQASGIPIEAPVSAVRIGLADDGSFIVRPTFDQAENGDLDLVVAGTADAITMVEAGANLISDEVMIKALDFAHQKIKQLCAEQESFKQQLTISDRNEDVVLRGEASALSQELLDKCLSDEDFQAIEGVGKKEVKTQLKTLKNKLIEFSQEKIDSEEVTEKDLKTVFDKKFVSNMRAKILQNNKRVDGRKNDDIRQLKIDTKIFNRLHGSGLFQRGETQALSILTIAGPKSAQLIDDPDQAEYEKPYLHHYNFPPYSVGEARMMRGVSRREIGHGALAERALRYVVPTKDDGFPYTLRVVSEVLSCNGSSSMASVCGSTLALMDGGVPIKSPIAGIAMGMVMDEDSGEYKILSDIQGLEDASGDMDFKITGNKEGITALQMDIKIKGLKLELLAEALQQAKIGRKFILSAMHEAIPEVRKTFSEFAPLIITVKINPKDIGAVIGKGGEVIQDLCKTFNAEIDIDDDGIVLISGQKEQAEQVKKAIEAIVYEPQAGDVFTGCKVKTLKDFGAFVEFMPGKDAMVHISEIAEERVENINDYLKEGQIVNVKYLGLDKAGRQRFSIKATEQN